MDLLTTGVDVPCIRNIVFFKYLKSPISLYQMIGRGMRIDAPTRKLMFRVYDYTDATRLFGKSFITRPPTTGGDDPEPPPPLPPEPTISVDGFDVHITDAGRYIVADVDGVAMPVPLEEYKARLAGRLVHEVPTRPTSGCAGSIRRCVRNLSTRWSPPVIHPTSCAWSTRRRTATCTTCWRSWAGAWPRDAPRPHAGLHLQTRGLDQRGAACSGRVRAIASQFERGGTDGLENPQIFRTPEVWAAGGLAALHTAGDPALLLVETKARMFAA